MDAELPWLLLDRGNVYVEVAHPPVKVNTDVCKKYISVQWKANRSLQKVGEIIDFASSLPEQSGKLKDLLLQQRTPR